MEIPIDIPYYLQEFYEEGYNAYSTCEEYDNPYKGIVPIECAWAWGFSDKQSELNTLLDMEIECESDRLDDETQRVGCDFFELDHRSDDYFIF